MLPDDIGAFRVAAQALLDADDAPHATIDDTLTSGYAHALALESERRRLERLILAAATTPGRPGSRCGGSGLSHLADEFWRTDALLRDLRETLERLKRHRRARPLGAGNGVA